jgi:hypothetical protein
MCSYEICCLCNYVGEIRKGDFPDLLSFVESEGTLFHHNTGSNQQLLGEFALLGFTGKGDIEVLQPSIIISSSSIIFHLP